MAQGGMWPGGASGPGGHVARGGKWPRGASGQGGMWPRGASGPRGHLAMETCGRGGKWPGGQVARETSGPGGQMDVSLLLPFYVSLYLEAELMFHPSIKISNQGTEESLISKQSR